jgi:glycerate 2-kinase
VSGASVLIAPDSFGGSMSASEAAAAIGAGWHDAAPDDHLVALPLSDGGPGFVEVLHRGIGGQLVDVDASDPLGRPIRAHILMTDGADYCAYIESAEVCGLHLLQPAERDPARTTTAGVAALLRAAVAAGARQIVVGLGGSGTNDAGAGMIEALGADAQLLRGVELLVATDVDIPLLGPSGATAIFAPQKGATPDSLPLLEQRLATFATVIGAEFADLPGAGAAGGLGFGLFALGGHRVSGADLVLQLLEVGAHIAASDLVITGEGSLDEQSLAGKLPVRVAASCLEAGVPCVAIAGRVMLGRRHAAAAGFAEAHSIEGYAGSLEASLALGQAGLRGLAAQVAGSWHGGR